MALIVQKYGGTSVGTVERIEKVAERVMRWRAAGHDIVVVTSAMSGETNRLLGMAKGIDANATPRELDMLAATGEQVTIACWRLRCKNAAKKHAPTPARRCAF